MKTFLLTHEFIPGSIFLYEDECGKVRCDFKASDASAKQQAYLLEVAVLGIPTLQKSLGEGAKLTELKANFEMFWQKYDDKINSSKKRAELKWNKMNAQDQQRAYDFIPRYFANIPSGTRRKYAETYLNAELWNN